jgi:hypothetical protein
VRAVFFPLWHPVQQRQSPDLPAFTACAKQAGISPSQVRFDFADISLYYCFT